MAAESKGTGLEKNTAGALSYVLGPITGVVFFILEKDKFVRFHAVQSIVVFIGLFVLQAVMTFTIILFWMVPLVTLAGFILWLLLIYKAWQGEEWEVPVVGSYVRKILKKV